MYQANTLSWLLHTGKFLAYPKILNWTGKALGIKVLPYMSAELETRKKVDKMSL
jgi:hypothetical protein